MNQAEKKALEKANKLFGQIRRVTPTPNLIKTNHGYVWECPTCKACYQYNVIHNDHCPVCLEDENVTEI